MHYIGSEVTFVEIVRKRFRALSYPPSVPWELSGLLRTFHADHSSIRDIKMREEEPLELRWRH